VATFALTLGVAAMLVIFLGLATICRLAHRSFADEAVA